MISKAEQIVRDGGSILLVGNPGSGKITLARKLSQKRAFRRDWLSDAIYKMSGLQLQLTSLPFRAPHHTASLSALKGNADQFRPGESSLAHGGTLLLDEAPEFPHAVRQFVADTHRLKEVYFDSPYLKKLPADFALIATRNLCGCGRNNLCCCSEDSVAAYASRLRMFDFDLTVDMSML